MGTNRLLSFVRKARFQAIMMIISLIIFILLYLVFTVGVIEPFFIKGLVFLVPFICFTILYYLTAKNHIKPETSNSITFLLLILLAVAMAISLLFLMIDASATSTTDIRHYKKALTKFPDEVSTIFPQKIPSGSKNVNFFYTPPLGQGGEEIALKFETDSDSIQKYKEKFSKQAKWVGKVNDNEAERYGVNFGMLSIFNSTYSKMPNNDMIYVINSEPYKTGDYNHGKISLAAINEQNNEIMFLAEIW
jgi:hypothetical protein